MMMILKSMGVDVNKVDMENYSAEVDEEETGKFTFNMFCQGEQSGVLEVPESDVADAMHGKNLLRAPLCHKDTSKGKKGSLSCVFKA